MNVKIKSTKTIKPIHEGIPPSTTHAIPLSVLDKSTYSTHAAQIFAYHPPTPPNAVIEYGIRRALSKYREFAGRLGEDDNCGPVIRLNDKGGKLVEASVDTRLDLVMPDKPCPHLCCLYPSIDDVEELVQFQLTRFTCGSLVIGYTLHHFVADGTASFNFLVACGKAARGVKMDPLPLHDRTIFRPRNPPRIEFENGGFDNRGIKFIRELVKEFPDEEDSVNDIIVHKVNFTSEFIAKLKAMASASASASSSPKPYTTFESLVAHLWRTIAKARRLDGSEKTHLIISVNGRSRLRPKVPNEYFGNVVQWAFPRSTVSDIIKRPLPFTAKLIRDAIANINDDYFKSFIDFATYMTKKEDLHCFTKLSAKSFLCPNLEVNSWLQFPAYDIDFGGGSPYLFLPSYFPMEGMMYLLPSAARDGSVDAFVFLFRRNLAEFLKFVYEVDQWQSHL